MTFAEAARRLGHRSRSTLYRLKAETRLDHYLVEGPNGSQLLEMAPPDRPTLEAYLAAVLDPGRGPQARRREQRSQRDRRWELVAATLSAALEGIGGPSLTAKEAELLAERMGPATWETFPEGLPGGIPRDPPHPLGDGTTIMDILWDPLAKEGNHWLVEGGWRFPRLTAEEFLLVWKVAEDWMEGTTFDTESEAWWRPWRTEPRETPARTPGGANGAESPGTETTRTTKDQPRWRPSGRRGWLGSGHPRTSQKRPPRSWRRPILWRPEEEQLVPLPQVHTRLRRAYGRLMASRQKPCFDWPLWFRRNPPRKPERNRPRLSSGFRSAFHPPFIQPPEPSHRLGSGFRQAR